MFQLTATIWLTLDGVTSDIRSSLNRDIKTIKNYQSDLDKISASSSKHKTKLDIFCDKIKSNKAKKISKLKSQKLFKKLINRHKRFKVSENDEQHTGGYNS